MKHVPVLLREVLTLFEGVELLTCFDGTLGAGGHASAILKEHPEIKTYIGCDKDPRALEIAEEVLEPWKSKVKLIRGSYAQEICQFEGTLDGFLIDIGVSSMQFDEVDRGFSFKGEAPLDMRMDPSQDLTAEDVIRNYSEERLARIFFEYGEETRSRKIAKEIVQRRRKKPIRTTRDLSQIIEACKPKGRLHPATLVFQALRIEVNDELGELQRALEGMTRAMRSQGRAAVISFHSLEDRIVKNYVRSKKEELLILTKKPLVASREEAFKNPRARSAKLRAVEKK